VLDGELSIRCGSEVFDAARGSFVFLPRGRLHQFCGHEPVGQAPHHRPFQAALKTTSADQQRPRRPKTSPDR
jgi:hypothetical protein